MSKDVAALIRAFALTLDLQHFLRGEPITARSVSSLERAWRWCRRNRLVASLVASTAAALILGTVIATVLAVVANRRAESIAKMNNELIEARDMADRTAAESNMNAADADEQSQLTLKMLESVIYRIQGELAEIPAAQGVRGAILQQASTGLTSLSERLRERPRVDRVTAEITLSLAEVFCQIGDSDGAKGPSAAVPLFDRAVAMFEKLVATSPDQSAATRSRQSLFARSRQPLASRRRSVG